MPDRIRTGRRAYFLIKTSQRIIRVKGPERAAACTGFRAVPPFIFDPDMPERDTRADEQRQSGQPDQSFLMAGFIQAEHKRNHSQSDNGFMGMALPIAHRAGRIAKAILKYPGPDQ